jgi:hypothetical protein
VKQQRKTRGRKNYLTTVTSPSGYVKTYYPRMCFTYHAEGDATFRCRARNLGERNIPRKPKKWVRKDLFREPRWKPWWTGQNRQLTVVYPAGILRTRKRKS